MIELHRKDNINILILIQYFYIKNIKLFEQTPLLWSKHFSGVKYLFKISNSLVGYISCVYISCLKRFFKFFFTHSFAKHFGPNMLQYYIRVFLYIIILQIALFKKTNFPTRSDIDCYNVNNLNYCYFYIKLWTSPWVPSIGPEVTGCTNYNLHYIKILAWLIYYIM